MIRMPITPPIPSAAKATLDAADPELQVKMYRGALDVLALTVRTYSPLVARIVADKLKELVSDDVVLDEAIERAAIQEPDAVKDDPDGIKDVVRAFAALALVTLQPQPRERGGVR